MSDEDYVDKHLKRLVEKGPDTLASLRAEVASKNEQFQQYARKMELDMNDLGAENARLKARIRELEEALERIDIGFVQAKDAPAMHDEAIRIARAALKGETDEVATEVARSVAAIAAGDYDDADVKTGEQRASWLIAELQNALPQFGNMYRQNPAIQADLKLLYENFENLYLDQPEKTNE